jgi:hypothetical protein
MGESMSNPLGPLSCGPLSRCGDPPTACTRVVIEFVLEGADLGIGLCEEALESVSAAV